MLGSLADIDFMRKRSAAVAAAAVRRVALTAGGDTRSTVLQSVSGNRCAFGSRPRSWTRSGRRRAMP